MNRNEQIVAAYSEGATQQRIAERFGLSQTTVSKILRKHGVTPGRGGPRILPTDRILRRQYEKLRDILGVETARREMGL